MPMSATVRCPRHGRAAGLAKPTLGREKVMVASARTASPGATPESASNPLGTSTDSRGHACATPLAQWIAAATAPEGTPLAPMPKSASTITARRGDTAGSAHGVSCHASGEGSTRGRSPAAVISFHARRASPRKCAGTHVSRTSTS